MKKHTLLGVAVACTLNSVNVNAFSDDEITVWMPIDKGQKGMTYAVEQFEADTGIKVNVEYPEGLEQRFVQVASVGKGPDIMIFAHDRFGGYADSGLVREVNPSLEYMDKFEPFTWEATKYKGKKYGYPITAESISLIYNKALLDKPLENWEDIFALDKELSKNDVKAIAWELKSPYFTQPLYSGAGAYVFEETQEGLDPNSTGVNTPEAKRTMNFMKSLVDEGVVSQDMDYAYAEAAFAKGQVAMTINGPWAWPNLDQVGMDYGVVQLPKFEGKATRPFVGILMAGISTASPNRELATEFIENYLLSIESLRYMNDQVAIGAPALKAFAKELEADPRVKGTLANARNGDVMPNIPEINRFWHGQNAALTNIIDGRQSVEDALIDLEKRVLDK